MIQPKSVSPCPHLGPLLQRLLLQGCQSCQQQLQTRAAELPLACQAGSYLGQLLLIQPENQV